MCDEWRESYAAFAEYVLTELGERPDGCSIDRIENATGSVVSLRFTATGADDTDISFMTSA